MRRLRPARGRSVPQPRRPGELRAPEEAARVNPLRPAHVVAVDVYELHRGHAQPGAFEHVPLHGDVVEVVELHRGRGLHLAEPEGAPAEALERVDVHAHAVALEHRLEDRGHGRVAEERPRLGERLELAKELCMIMDGAYVARLVTGDPTVIGTARRLADRAIREHLGG